MIRRRDSGRPAADGRPTAWQRRDEILRLRQQGMSLRGIASVIGRHSSQVAIVLHRIKVFKLAGASMPRQTYFREGSTLVQIQCYAPGDGRLSFVARNIKTGEADPNPPSEAECKAVCPYGWLLYQEGPNWRAVEARDAFEPVGFSRGKG